jgi:hypothetical protein
MIILLKDNDITENTVLGGNIDVDRLRVCILDAQMSRLEELLGEDLYEKIETDFEANSLADEYLILHRDYIKPFLIRQGALEFLKVGAFTVANNGISVPSPQNTTPIDSKMLNGLINEMRMKADMFAERMYKWLCKSRLPEYVSHSDNIINPQKPSFGSWYLETRTLTPDEWIEKKMR